MLLYLILCLLLAMCVGLAWQNVMQGKQLFVLRKDIEYLHRTLRKVGDSLNVDV